MQKLLFQALLTCAYSWQSVKVLPLMLYTYRWRGTWSEFVMTAVMVLAQQGLYLLDTLHMSAHEH